MTKSEAKSKAPVASKPKMQTVELQIRTPKPKMQTVQLEIRTVTVHPGGTYLLPIRTTTPGDGERYVPASHNAPVALAKRRK